jgi:hypothetical protein
MLVAGCTGQLLRLTLLKGLSRKEKSSLCTWAALSNSASSFTRAGSTSIPAAHSLTIWG